MIRVRTRKKYTLKSPAAGFNRSTSTEFLETESHFDEKGNLVRELKYEPDNTGCEVLEFEYNEKGQLTRQRMSAEGESEIEETIKFEHDDKGRLLKEVKYYGTDEGEVILIEYGAHDKPVRVTRSDPDGDPESEEIMEYDGADKLISHKVKNLSEGTELISQFAYNDDGKPKMKEDTDENGYLITKVIFEYDEKGLLTKETELNSDDELISEIFSQYDERENIVQRDIRDFNSRKLVFEFDDNDNCIKEEIYDENGKMIMKTVFEFNQYNLPIIETSVATGIAFGVTDGNKESRFDYEYYN